MRCKFCPVGVNDASLCLVVPQSQTGLQVRPASKSVAPCDYVLDVGKSRVGSAIQDIKGVVSFGCSCILSLQGMQQFSRFLLDRVETCMGG